MAKQTAQQTSQQTTAQGLPQEEIAMPEDEMHTLVDRMLSFIQEHGKTTVAEIADVFAMDQAQVERLASVLEESGLISMRYALLHPGRTELISLKKKEAPLPSSSASAASSSFPSGSGSSSSSASKSSQSAATSEPHDFDLRELMKGVDLDMQESQQALNTIERDVLSRLFRMEKTLTEIEKKERGAGKTDIDYLVREADLLEAMRKDMAAKLKTFDARIASVGVRIRGVKHVVRKGPIHSFVTILTSPFKRGRKQTIDVQIEIPQMPEMPKLSKPQASPQPKRVK
jgi:DNA-binding transcriptional ArsR family regulator